MANNLVKQEQLSDILNDLWGKVKNRDITAGEVTADTGDAGANRKLKLKRKDNTNTVEINFSNVALLDKINEFQKYGAFPDVALDELKSFGTEALGTGTGGFDPSNQWSGSRNFSSDMFYDGYVNKLRVYVRNEYTNPRLDTIEVYCMNKTDALATDTVASKIGPANYNIVSNNGKKYIEIPINKKFNTATYFLVTATSGQNAQSIIGISASPDNGIVHLSKATSQTTLNIGDTLPNTTNNSNVWCINYEVIGRMSVKEAIDIITSEEYVLVSDTTVEGGTANAGKVVKLDGQGKLHTSVLPELAINRVLSAPNQGAVQGMLGNGENQIQIGDVVVLEDSKKVYMYKGQTGNSYNFDNDFLELTMGNGTVKKVNGGTPDSTGNVTAAITNSGTDIKLKFGTDGTDIVIGTYMTTQEVNNIKALFTFD